MTHIAELVHSGGKFYERSSTGSLENPMDGGAW